MEHESDGGYEVADDGGSQWAAPDPLPEATPADAPADSRAHPSDSMMSFDPAYPALTHGGLDIAGLTVPASLTDPSAHPGADPGALAPDLFAPLPAAPHHPPSTLGEKVYDQFTNPTPPPAPPEDPTELERQRQEHASQNAIGQHTPMSPEIKF